MARRILLARHGAAEGAPRGFLGRTDLPLGAEGRRQAARLAELVRAHRPARCFASPLRRARETAGIVAESLNLVVEVVPELIEVDFGNWEGRTFAEISAAEPDAARRWAEWDAGFGFPGGEGLAAFLERVHGAVERLAAEPAGTVLAVAHGGVVRAALCRLLGLEARSYLAFDVKHGALAAVDVEDGRGVLCGLDNSAHLEG